MSSLARRRVVKDLKQLMEDPPPGVLCRPFEENMMVCHAVMRGPVGTCWETGTFHVIVRFGEEYPTRPPRVVFLSRLFHPNVYPNGEICLDLLQNNWSPAMNAATLLASIQSLLGDPNTNSPANPAAATLCETDELGYTRKVIECVEDSWIAPQFRRSVVFGV